MSDEYCVPNIPPKSKFYSLSFWLQPLGQFKHAIASLSDPTFNPSGLAVLQVGAKGFEITVDGSDDSIGFLQLTSSSKFLRGFVCRDELLKTIDLKEINRVFNGVTDDDNPVNIMIIRDKNELNIGFPFAVLDHVPSEVFPVKMTAVNPYCYISFPTVSYGLEAVIPSSDLVPMINEILEAETKPPFVIVDIEAKTSLKVQDHSRERDPVDRHIWFQWNNWSALKTATNVANKCGIRIVTDPKPHIMFRFNLGEIGDLVFLKYSDLCYGKDGFRHLGTFGSYFSAE